MTAAISGQWGLNAATTAAPAKTSLENISSCYLHYFALIPMRPTSTMWPNYPVTELVGTVFKLAQRMKIYCMSCSHNLHNP